MQTKEATTVKKFHWTDEYILNPMHKITVLLIGVGGTGSRMLTNLAMIDQSLVALGHPGLFVAAMDDDKVSDANIGRQQFSPQDIGYYKSDVLISRINRFYGLQWKSVTSRFSDNKDGSRCNIIISCVDNLATRKMIHKVRSNGHHNSDLIYWLDMGNGKDYGQVILSTKRDSKSKGENHKSKLPGPFHLFKGLDKEEEGNEPSCSLREALTKQDLFINPIIATYASDLLWKLFTKGKLDYHGAFVNMETLQVNKLKVT